MFCAFIYKVRGIEWSLRAFASRRAVGLFLRAPVVKFVLRAASTLENAYGEQRQLCEFCANRNLFVLKMEALFYAK